MSRLILKFTSFLALSVFFGVATLCAAIANQINLDNKQIWEGNCTVAQWISRSAGAMVVGHAICGGKEFTFENSTIAAAFLQSGPREIFCRGRADGSAQCAIPGSNKE